MNGFRKVGAGLIVVVSILTIGITIAIGRQRQSSLLADQAARYSASAAKEPKTDDDAQEPAVDTNAAPDNRDDKVRNIGKNRDLKYVALGDSLAAGYNTSEEKKAYQYLVENYLSDTMGFNTTLQGRWAPGNTVGGNALEEYNEVLGMKPDLITIEYGTNEQDRTNQFYARPETFLTNLSSLVGSYKTAFPNAKIVLLTTWKAETYEEYDAQIKAVAEKYDVKVADITDVWRKSKDTIAPKGAKSWRGEGDGYHPNDKGNREIADAIIKQLVDLYAE